MQDSFVARSAGACPTSRVCCNSGFDLVELVIDNFAFGDTGRSKPSGGIEGTPPLANRLISAPVTVFA